jgi:hypothetical protein
MKLFLSIIILSLIVTLFVAISYQIKELIVNTFNIYYFDIF